MAAKKTEELMIVNRRTDKALQASGTDNGQNVVQAAQTGEDAQLWSQVESGEAVKFVNKASGKALDVVHGGVENGTWAHIWDDVDAASQQWRAVKIGATSPYKKLVNVQSGKVLDIVDMSEEDGAPAQIWDDVDGVGQHWKFVAPAPSKTVTKTTKKAAEPAKKEIEEKAAPAEKKPGRKPHGQKVAEAVKETAETVKEAAEAVVKEVVAKPARKPRSRKVAEAKEAAEKKAARGKK